MSTRIPNGWGDPSTERHLQVPPRHATGSRAPDPDELARVEKNLRDEVRRRLNEETPDRAAYGFGRRDPWSKWHKLVGIDSTRCGTALFFRNGGGTTNSDPPGFPGQLCQRCFPEARDV